MSEHFCNLALFQSAFGSFADGFTHQLASALRFGLATPVIAVLGYESAQPLSAIDDPLAFQFLVGALDGDHTDHELFGKLPEGRERGPAAETPLADLAPETIDDLLIERARRGRRNRREQPGISFLGHAA